MRSSFLVLVLIISLSGCQMAPVSDISPGETPATDSDIGGLWYISNKVEEQIKYAPNRIKDPQATEFIRHLMCRISPEYCKDIRVYIMDKPYFNAFMMPNGVMVVWTGLLLRAESEDQVAFVLGHELGHFVKQHSIQSFRKLKNAENWMLVLAAVSPTAAMVGSFTAVGTLMKYSRDFEREADSYSIETLQNLGFNPGSGADLFRFVQEEHAADKKKYSPFFATHPSDQERIDTIAKHSNITEFNEIDNERFNQIKSRYLDAWLDREVSKRSYDSSEVLLTRLKASNPDSLLFDFYLGELYRKRASEGDYDLAITHYQTYAKSADANAAVHKKIASVYRKLDDNTAAITSLKTYLNKTPDAADAEFIADQITKLKGTSL